MTFKILVVEDEIDFKEVLVDLLLHKGYEAVGIDSIASYKELAEPSSFNLIILDRTLPDGDGLTILEMHRMISTIPVIILSGLTDIEERVKGFGADADHYLVKPVVMPELLAIIKRCSRQLKQGEISSQNCWNIILRQWELVAPNGLVIKLTNSELTILLCLKDASKRMVHRDQIVIALGFSPDSYDVRRLESLVSRLRNKVKTMGIQDFPLVAVYGSGYSFNAPMDVTENAL
jgi:DNA-binding response OmpR family regulator